MNRITRVLSTGLLVAAAGSPCIATAQAAAGTTTAALAASNSAQPSALAAMLSQNLALHYAIDNNHAAAAGVPCAALGADWASCATGRLTLVNRGQQTITDGGWKLYLHSIRRIFRIENPGFALRHLTGDLYELTPQPGALRLAPGARLELPFVAEYWFLRYSDLLPRPYVVVAGARPAVLQYNDTDDETRYVESLPADAQNNSRGNAPIRHR